MSRLAEIQAQLQVPKKRFNSFGNYYYRSAEDILEAVKPLLKDKEFIKCNSAVVQLGPRYYVKCTATLFVTVGEEDETYTADGVAREQETRSGMDQAQLTGACDSYAKKYALQNLFAICESNDQDSLPSGNGAKEPPPPSSMPHTPAAPEAPQASHGWQKGAQGLTPDESTWPQGAGQEHSPPPAPPQQSPAAAAGYPAPNPKERETMNALRDYFKRLAPDKKFNTRKFMDVVWLNMRRWPSADADVNLVKQYVTIEEVMD